jgi:hypothetical protein
VAASVAALSLAAAVRFPAAAAGRAIVAQAALVRLKPADDHRRDSPSGSASFKAKPNRRGPIAAAEHRVGEPVESPDDLRTALQLPEDALQNGLPVLLCAPRIRPVLEQAVAVSSARAIAAERRGNLEPPTDAAAVNSDRLNALDEPADSTVAAEESMADNGAARNAAEIGRSVVTAAAAALGATWRPTAASGNGAAGFTIGTGIGTAGFP